MNALTEIKARFATALGKLTDNPEPLLAMIKPAQNAERGDYQANCAMPLRKQLGKPSEEIAAELVKSIEVGDLCSKVKVAGPGFINLTLDENWLKSKLTLAIKDERLGITPVANPRTYVVDYSSPNVAKEMHVGHIRSTVIGDSISNILRFVGHNVITDNHIGDWGTQFGMIIYGYKHFLDTDYYKTSPVKELGRLYKYVRKLMDYHSAMEECPKLAAALEKQNAVLSELQAKPTPEEKKQAKAARKELKRANEKVAELNDKIAGVNNKITAVEGLPDIKNDADAHPDIRMAVLTETSKLHSGDQENNQLWSEFVPVCRADIQRIYDRLGIKFDNELGESFFHELLPGVVDNFRSKGLSRVSEGAECVFLEGHEAPMIIQKSDGAYLYATTDLATIKYRMDHWKPDVVLYVVDFRQGGHFGKLFDAAKLWGYTDTNFQHVEFGTVLGDDGKPFKTRSGDTVGLEGLLDEAERRSLEIAKAQNEDLTEEQHQTIARVVGIGGLKYADLSINRTSDYKFNYDQMLALKGNTATYLQYGYARVFGILRKGGIDDPATLRESPVEFILDHPMERALAVSLTKLGESCDESLVDYKPNLLANYLYDLSNAFNQFFAQCPVLKAESEALKTSRLQLCDLTARTLKCGLGLLGIDVVEQM